MKNIIVSKQEIPSFILIYPKGFFYSLRINSKISEFFLAENLWFFCFLTFNCVNLKKSNNRYNLSISTNSQ